MWSFEGEGVELREGSSWKIYGEDAEMLVLLKLMAEKRLKRCINEKGTR